MAGTGEDDTTFVKTITSAQAAGGPVSIPTRLAKWFPQSDHWNLTDGKGHQWKVFVRSAWRNGPGKKLRLDLSGGWRQVVKDLDIKENTELKFQILGVAALQVTVLNRDNSPEVASESGSEEQDRSQPLKKPKLEAPSLHATDEEDSGQLEGRSVLKCFTSGWCKGLVSSWDSEGNIYTVDYENGERETITLPEVHKILFHQGMLVGFCVKKYFLVDDVPQVFCGKVVSYSNDNRKYRVLYEDTDTESMREEELLPLLINKSVGKARSSISDPPEAECSVDTATQHNRQQQANKQRSQDDKVAALECTVNTLQDRVKALMAFQEELQATGGLFQLANVGGSTQQQEEQQEHHEWQDKISDITQQCADKDETIRQLQSSLAAAQQREQNLQSTLDTRTERCKALEAMLCEKEAATAQLQGQVGSLLPMVMVLMAMGLYRSGRGPRRIEQRNVWSAGL